MKTLLVSTVVVGIAVGAAAQVIAQATPAKITITSSAFKDGEMIPKDYTGDTGAKNVSPPLAWTGAPASTKEFALILDDPDAAQFNNGQPYVHWIVYNIPGTVKGLPEGLPAGKIAEGPLNGAVQGMSNMVRAPRGGGPAPAPVYRGPAPPAGSGPHHYTFTVYALDAPIPASETLMNKTQLLDVIKGHIVGEGKLIGIFQR